MTCSHAARLQRKGRSHYARMRARSRGCARIHARPSVSTPLRTALSVNGSLQAIWIIQAYQATTKEQLRKQSEHKHLVPHMQRGWVRRRTDVACTYLSSGGEDPRRFRRIITRVWVEGRRQHTSSHRRLSTFQRSPVIAAAMYKLRHHAQLQYHYNVLMK